VSRSCEDEAFDWCWAHASVDVSEQALAFAVLEKWPCLGRRARVVAYVARESRLHGPSDEAIAIVAAAGGAS